MDIKYFFGRYFGVGIQGFALDAKRSGFDIDSRPLDEVLVLAKRPPIVAWSARSWGHLPCVIRFRARVFRLMRGRGSARFSVVAIATDLSLRRSTSAGRLREGGGDDVPFVNARTVHSGTRTELMGQFGGGH